MPAAVLAALPTGLLTHRASLCEDQALPAPAATRTFDDLVAATGGAIDTVTEADAHGFFAHCGYLLPEPN